MALIQRAQVRRGLPLISIGPESALVLREWQDALAKVPDACLDRAYDRAAENWDWHDTRHPFTADAIAQAYTLLVVEDRQRAEAQRRNAARRNPETYACWHCCDVGYQLAFVRDRDRWYSSVRACCCDLAPVGARNSFPLEGPVWVRNKLGEYVKREELEQYGPPNEAFESVIKAGEGGSDV